MIWRMAVTGAFLISGVTSAWAQQQDLHIEWSSNVTEYRGQNGRRLTLICPPDGSIGEIYGTDTYTDDSSVCSAATHAGIITPPAGGLVSVVIAPGQTSYTGSSRNTLASKSFGQWSGSFTFDRANGEGTVDWGTRGSYLNLAGRPLTVVCPPGGSINGIWGTDVYTADSSICTAAVHAGLVTFASGGRVTLEHVEKPDEYSSSTRNGVQSGSYGYYVNSFRFVGRSVAAAPTQLNRVVQAAASPPAASSRSAVSPAASQSASGTVSVTATEKMAGGVQPQRAPQSSVTSTPGSAPTGQVSAAHKGTLGALQRGTLTVTPQTVALEYGSSQQLTAEIQDDRGIAQPLSPSATWSATGYRVGVDQRGLITGLALDNYPTTVTVSDRGLTGTAKVTVVPIPLDPFAAREAAHARPLPNLTANLPLVTRTNYFDSEYDRALYYVAYGAGAEHLMVTVTLTGIAPGRNYDLYVSTVPYQMLSSQFASKNAGNADETLTVEWFNSPMYIMVVRQDGLPSSLPFTLGVTSRSK